jgi:hypothetical protein
MNESSSWPPWVERWVLPYVNIPALLPVLIAVMGHIVILVALVVLEAWRSRNPFAIAATVLLLAGTVRVLFEEWRRLRRLGPLSATLAIAWLATIGTVALADHYGFL